MRKRLKLFNNWQITGISLGVVWSLVLGTLFSQLPVVQKLELLIQDNLVQLNKPDSLPDKILIVTIDQPIVQPEHTFYTNLVKRLIGQGAKVVVINLPHSLRRPLDSRLENPFKELIKKYPDQIVLVTYTKKYDQTIPSSLSIYYHLLPFDDKKIQPLIAPEQVHGFFEYEDELKDLTSPSRRSYLTGNFVAVEDLHQIYELKSFAVLALEKFSQPGDRKAIAQNLAPRKIATISQNKPKLYKNVSQTAVGINFYNSDMTFNRLDIDLICKLHTQLNLCDAPLNNLYIQKVRNKLVLIDLPQEYQASFGISSPRGDRLSVAQMQANVLGNLMTDSFLKTSPSWFNFIITTLGAIVVSLVTTSLMVKNNSQCDRSKFRLFLGVIGGYISLSLLSSWQGLIIIPIATPILTWLGTGASVAVCLLLWQKQQQLHQQRRKLAERQAILSHTRKLLHRVATDIHDGPLQELKLVMDGIELLAIKHPMLNPNPLLDRLETVGRELREQLLNTRTMAEKLEITPQLQAGLDQGIKQYLQQLINARELTLKVESCLQPLTESEDSQWIDAREDIYCFFKEAISNVIRHAQPPNGTATKLKVSLSQLKTQCMLIIENDAAEILALESSSRERHSGGYGTKLMATIAEELPNGDWERVLLAHGGMQIRLAWEFDVTAEDESKS